jgi:hypothetical protein
MLAGAKASESQAAVISPDASALAVTTPGGSGGYLPVYSSATTIDDSVVFQSAAKVGIATNTPQATLDVNGSVAARGAVTLESNGTAAAASGKVSQQLQLAASVFNSTSNAVATPMFALQAEPSGNDTATPSGTLNLLFGQGAYPAETGLSISSKGILKFAPGQTFPASSTTGVGLTGTSSSGNGVEGTSASGNGVEGITNGTTVGTGGVMGIAGVGNKSGFGGIAGVWGNASAHVGVLGTSDQYAGVQGISNSSYGVQGTSNSNTAVLGESTSGSGVSGLSTSNSGVAGYTAGSTLNTAGVLGLTGSRTGQSGIAGVWGDTAAHVGVLGTSTQYEGVQGISSVGAGVAGSSITGDGAFGYTIGNTLGTAGALGVAGTRTSFTGISAVWGDAAAHVGVFGSSNQYSGVQGSSVSGPGVQGNSTSGNGVHGVSSSTSGIFGETSSSSSLDAGLFGYAHGSAMGVYGSSASGPGVVGTSTLNIGVTGNTGSGTAVQGNASTGLGGYFLNNSTTNAALEGQNNSGWGGGSSPYPISVLGYANGSGNGTPGVGVQGFAYNGAGVYGIGGGSTGPGVFDTASHSFGVVGDTTGGSDTAILGAANNSYAGLFKNNSILASVFGFNYGSGSGVQSNFRTIEGATPDGVCGFGDMGNLTCSGQLKSLASTDDARTVETYSMQSPENWIEDFGSGTVEHGVAKVTIDPLFAKTVSATADYHVFLTPNGDSKGLYVVAKTATGFEVRESGGGTSTLAFDYRIVAKRRGYEAQRLTDVTEQFKAEKARIDDHIKEAAAIYDKTTHTVSSPASARIVAKP